MPSAASVKVEKPPTTNISANNAVVANKDAVAPSENVDNNSPVRQISLIIEHKIRNLEKRKVSFKRKKNPKKVRAKKNEYNKRHKETSEHYTEKKK